MRISKVYQMMFQAVLEDGLESIMKTAYDIMKMPVAITDTSYTIIGLYPENKTGDRQWDSNKVNQQIIPEAIIAFQNDGHWEALRKAGGAICADWGYCREHPRYSVLIEKDDKLLGCMAFLIGDEERRDWHIKAIDIIAKAVGLAMAREDCLQRNAVALKKILMKSLIDGNIGSREQFVQMADMAKFNLQTKYVLAGIIQRNVDNEFFSNYLSSEIYRVFPDAMGLKRGNRLYLLIDGHQISKKEASFNKIGKELLETESIAFALSNVFNDPLEIKPYIRQVDNLIDTIIPMYEHDIVFHYSNHVTDIAMAYMVKNMMAENLTHPALEKLMQTDHEHHTEYLMTLKTYVQSLYNKNETADKLKIHRNTLFYRLEKINEITNVDIREANTANHLLLNFNYMDMIDKKYTNE